MESLNLGETCLKCEKHVIHILSEGIQCSECKKYTHLSCLDRGTVPGGLLGDVFFLYVCKSCSIYGTETFNRDKMPWFTAITIALYNMTVKTPGLARKGYFHFRDHIVDFIDKRWDIIFPKDFKKKMKWHGTVSGVLSINSPHFFISGTNVIKEQGWWTLVYPKLTPNVTMQINLYYTSIRQKLKEAKEPCDHVAVVQDIIRKKSIPQEYLTPLCSIESSALPSSVNIKSENDSHQGTETKAKNIKKQLLPSLETYQDKSKLKKLKKSHNGTLLKQECLNLFENNLDYQVADKKEDNSSYKKSEVMLEYKDPFCHYNTAFKDITSLEGVELKAKLMGGVREEPIFSPYSGIYLKPYIRRDTMSYTTWLQLMTEIQMKVNESNPSYTPNAISSIDYAYLQPEHLPAINSLCNQFFWPGIDLTDCLQYPDFSCVVLYKKLIVGFAFLVPDVKFNESYISFIFVRPGWRNVGIAKFMMYHLIQTCAGKDITLHVSTTNAALFLYQKFGFKVEKVVQNFYDKYMRKDSRESKHAFFCRLER